MLFLVQFFNNYVENLHVPYPVLHSLWVSFHYILIAILSVTVTFCTLQIGNWSTESSNSCAVSHSKGQRWHSDASRMVPSPELHCLGQKTTNLTLPYLTPLQLLHWLEMKKLLWRVGDGEQGTLQPWEGLELRLR